MTKHGSMLAFLLMLALSLSALGAQSSDGMSMPMEPADEDEVQSSSSLPLVDGVVTEGEYAHMVLDELIGMMVRWQAVGDTMFIAMIAPGTGWVGLNFMPNNGTVHGDTVIGYVDGDTQETFLSDQVAPGDAHFPHYDDRQHGGERSFIEVAGSEVDGVTIIEFSRALNTGESTDAVFMDMGLMTMISFHPTADDYVSYHSKSYDVVTINYISGEVMEAMDMSHTGSDGD
ncbi:hypothetical protein IH601_10650 [Candidatus Bipolaricaulota bacterium]|jgi:hypothetical protein|nr:hypothetical protein [Candidatus Bipolaricaulota bacterium]